MALPPSPPPRRRECAGLSSRLGAGVGGGGKGVSSHCKANPKAQGESAACLLSSRGLGTALREAWCSHTARPRRPHCAHGVCPAPLAAQAAFGSGTAAGSSEGWRLWRIQQEACVAAGGREAQQGLDKGCSEVPSPPPTMLPCPDPPWPLGQFPLLLPKPHSLAEAQWQLRNVKRSLSLSKWPERARLALWGVGTMETHVPSILGDLQDPLGCSPGQ